jgi:putative transcriptional regulator
MKEFRSDAMTAIHETMTALHKVGAIGRQTMGRFDDACLTPVHSLSPKQTRPSENAIATRRWPA